MKTVRGKLIMMDNGQTKFFPALPRSPLGALDAAPERDDDDAHAAAVAHALDCDDAQAEELQAALDRRAGARDRRARDEELSRADAYARARDGSPDHRDDFRPLAAGGPENPTAKDARLAHDRAARARACPSVDFLFRGTDA